MIITVQTEKRARGIAFPLGRFRLGYWCVKKSSTGATQSQQWGSSVLGDIPVGVPVHLYL